MGIFTRPALCLALACAAVAAIACCVVSNGEWVRLADEKVIIVWDEAHKTQHFVRQAKFDAEAKDFGFIVPTPSVPRLAVTDPAAFEKLENLVPAEPATGTAGTAGMDAAAADGGVEVIRQERVGDYDATVVKATDGNAMNQWLKDNGYVSRPAMEEWLDHYAKQRWIFTAFKFRKGKPTGTWTQAIRVSFDTDRPRYPYKMPKDTWPEGYRRPLNVYFVAPYKIESKYVGSDSNWEAKVRWSGDLPEEIRGGLAADLDLKETDLPPKAVVTIFENRENPEGYDHDLYFAAAPSSGPWLWVGGGVATMVIVLLLARQRGSRTPSNLNPA